MTYSSPESDLPGQPMELPILLDPALLRSARRIYRTYCVLHPKRNKRPSGVAIHQKTHRGQLIFNSNPILLPGECFVSLKHLDAEIS